MKTVVEIPECSSYAYHNWQKFVTKPTLRVCTKCGYRILEERG